MSRTIAKRIGRGEDGMTVGAFLKSRMGFAPKQISRLKFREDGIRVNGRRQRTTAELKAGDLLEIRLEEGLRDTGPGRVEPCRGRSRLKILYEDPDLLAVEKPAGAVCHPSHGHYRDTVANQAAAYLKSRGEKGCVRLAGRLDKDTSGVLLFAKNRESAAALARQRETGQMEKIYLALVSGCPLKQEGTVDAPIGKVPGDLMRMQVAESGRPARTHYRILKTWEEHLQKRSLLLLTLEQGRTHQIRVHMAHIGCPLQKDPLYGRDPQGDGALLHAWKLRFVQPFTGKTILLTAGLPDWAKV